MTTAASVAGGQTGAPTASVSGVDELRGLLPPECLLEDPADTTTYATPWRGPAGHAELVVRPATVEQLRDTVRWAVRYGVRLVPQGANTGLVGAGVPGRERGSVVVSTSRLTAPLQVRPEDGVVIAGAGGLVSAVQAAAAAHGLFLPIDLSADASIGGLVATNAGGCRVLRYGDVRRRTVALQAVLADANASVVGDLRPLRKRNDGPRLTDLMIGSGGQLGIVTAAVLELAPIPAHRSTCFLLPAAGTRIAVLTQHLERLSEGRAAAIELLSRPALQLVAQHLPAVPIPFLPQVHDHVLMLELESDQDALLALLEKLPEGLLDDVVVVEPDRAWAVRHALSEAQARSGAVVGLDVCVPRAELDRLRYLVRARLRAKHPNVLLAEFGHVGDGGMHMNVVLPGTDPSLEASVRHLVYAAVQNCHGTFSAEHGLGPANLARWSEETPAGTRHAFASLKAALDPAHVLGNAEVAAALTSTSAVPRPDTPRNPVMTPPAPFALGTLPDTAALATEAAKALAEVGVDLASFAGDMAVTSPVTGGTMARLAWTDADGVDHAVAQAQQAQLVWRRTPAPARGAVVKRLGQLIAAHTDELATLVQIEVGKTRTEAVGEIVEIVDICDFAVGLSRQLYGNTMPSERPEHRIVETWQPLGVVGLITAFNFPAAVWGWNTALALVCGDTVVWKPSETTPLIALACQALLDQATAQSDAPAHLGQVVLGGRDVGQQLVDHPGVPLISATGSVRMGQQVGQRVARRFGRALLELGGNNAGIIAPSAELDLAVPASVFAAAGTAGQRCTTMRRAIVHNSVKDAFCERVAAAFDRLPVGSPFSEQTVVGPLINEQSWQVMQAALVAAQEQGGTVLAGGQRHLQDEAPDAFYVSPALVSMPAQTELMHEETFAPILYVVGYDDLDDAIALNNEVPQGLSSCIFTRDVREAEIFMSAVGSDCGIVNVNIGTSGAEIGGAFGGEKQTGGGRESGSDAWRQYMRRATATINASSQLALAQGVTFEL